MTKWPICVETILRQFERVLSISVSQISDIGVTIPLPKLSTSSLKELCFQTEVFLKKRNNVIKIDPPIYIVGDIHGNLFDLIRIFVLSRPPPSSKYLFLGDYVDRGKYSIEVVALLFALQLVYPEHIFLLRGNHEFESINCYYGFKDEVLTQHNSPDLYESFNRSFDWLPFVAIINSTIFCVHGGLSPLLNNLEQIETIQRPAKNYEADFVADLLWSDPLIENKTYVRSNRCTGVTFGESSVKDFLEQFNMKYILRAHQCVSKGIEKFGNTNLYTIFSCSNYDESQGNFAGLLFIGEDLTFNCYSLPPLHQIERNKALFESPQASSTGSLSYNVSTTLLTKQTELSKKNNLKIFGMRPRFVSGTNTYFSIPRPSTSYLPPLKATDD